MCLCDEQIQSRRCEVEHNEETLSRWKSLPTVELEFVIDVRPDERASR